jgi:hypothetical protein
LLIQTICEEMKMKSKKEIKTSKILEKNENLKNSKMSKNSDENNFVCKQNDKDCWHRYSSAMGDCV